MKLNKRWIFPIFLLGFCATTVFASGNYSSANKKEDQGDLKTRLLKLDTKQGLIEIEIHLAESMLPFAERIAETLEKEGKEIVEYFEWAPLSRVHFVLNPNPITANGFATPFPRNLIGLNNYPPLGQGPLVSNQNFIKGLVLHEFAHILHLDQTRGLLRGLRRIFGSVGKLGGVVPRWFSEGVAVWIESTYTEGGRLNHPLVEAETKRLFLDPEFCRTVDCLDDPGDYPGGQFPYWIGGFFLQHIEKEKPKTISCLLKENSSQVPFFLASVFTKCTGKRLTDSFAEFRKSFEPESYRKILRREAEDSESFGRWSFQKGAQGTSSYRVVMTVKGRKEFFEIKNLNTNEKNLVRSLGLVRQIQNVSPYSFQQNEVLFSQYSSLSFKDGKNWNRLNLSTGTIDRLKLPSAVDYLFEIDRDKWFGLRYVGTSWEVVRYMPATKSWETIETIEKLTDVMDPYVRMNQGRFELSFLHVFQNENGEEVYQVERIAKKGEREILYSSAHPIRYWGHFKNLPLIQGRDEFYYGPGKKWYFTELPAAEIAMVIRSGQDDKFEVLWSKNPKTLLQFKAPYPTKSKASQTLQVQKAAPVRETKLEETKSYLSWYHFLPNYWGFGFGLSNSASRTSVFTTLNDPKDQHTLALAGYYYDEFSEFSGSTAYQLSLPWFKLGLSYAKYFGKSGVTDEKESSESVGLSLSKSFFWHRFQFSPAPYYSASRINDRLSRRKIDQYGLLLSAAYQPIFDDHFFQAGTLRGDFFKQDVENREDYRGEEFRLDQRFHLGWSRLYFNQSISYGKLHKTGFTNGILYGGGDPSEDERSFHSFYGIDYGDAFGNEMFTSRTELDILLARNYSGWDLFPLFIRKTYFTLGYDYLKSDLVFIGNRLLSEDHLSSVHGSFRFATRAVYLAPIDFQFTYAVPLDPDQSASGEFLFLVKGSLLL